MSNLASMIMEGSGIGSFGNVKLKHSYDHENGAGLIAMESAEALRDIFEAEFYVPNTCTIKATMEGASCVEESSQATIMEASIKGAFNKIKEFFVSLKEKVKDFLHNIKRYLLGIFGNDQKWIASYEKDLKNLNSKELDGYEIKMYDYSKVENPKSKNEIAECADELLDNTKKEIETFFTKDVASNEKSSEIYEQECEQIYASFIKDFDILDPDDDIQKGLWSYFRNGADSEKDMETVEVGTTEINEFIGSIKNSPKVIKLYDDEIRHTDKMYSDTIKYIDNMEKRVKSSKPINPNDPNSNRTLTYEKSKKDGSYYDKTYFAGDKKLGRIASILRVYSSFMSRAQTFNNMVNTAKKTAFIEKNKAYKKALVGAFGYARKHNKKED